jgi:ATP-dependent RNA helicase DDX51/DBP6
MALQEAAALPWLTIPAAIAPDKAVRLGDVVGLHPSLAMALKRTGFATLFPVQATAWHVLAGGLGTKHDLCIAAPTGSGKTLAYVIPALQRCLSQPSSAGMRCLVLVPTKVLAKQVRQLKAPGSTMMCVHAGLHQQCTTAMATVACAFFHCSVQHSVHHELCAIRHVHT